MKRLSLTACSLALGLCLGTATAEESTPVKIDPLKLATLTRGMTMRSTALEYIEKRGEVVLKIQLPSPEAIDEVAKIASVDKVVSPTVITAYCNSKDFAALEKLGYSYEVLVPESMQIPKSRGDNDYRGFDGRADISTFPSYDGYVNLMEGFAQSYPDLCRLEEIGTSVEGRRILFLVISDNVNEDEAEPKVTYTSTMHGDETVGMIMYLKLAQHLLSNYNSDAMAKKLVDGIELWMCPDLNPDGTYRASGGSGQYGATRANANGIDINRCFPDVPQPNGKSLSSAPELKVTIDLDREQRFYIGADSHGGMEGLVMPWAYQKGIKAPKNKKVWQLLGNSFLPSMDQIFVCENGPYAAPGTKFDFGYYDQSAIVICPELSRTKPIQEGQFDYQWNRFKEPYINLLEQALFGIHGMVIDKYTGDPIKATIVVDELDDTYGAVETHSLGDFYHTATTGSYTVTVTPENSTRWDDTTFTVSVQNDACTKVELELIDKTVGVLNQAQVMAAPTFMTSRLSSGEMRVQYESAVPVRAAQLYSLSGKVVKELSFTQSGTTNRALIPSDISQGTYVISIETAAEKLTRRVTIQ